MPSSKLREKIRDLVRRKKRARDVGQRKQVEGHVNIEGVTKPKHRKPKEKEQDKVHKLPPASVSIGAHGGRYVQEASGHKRYLQEGTLSNRKKISKSVADMVAEIAMEDEKRNFLTNFKRKKKNERV